ncbi:MAG: enoyl-CoA hydratase-related protein [Sphingomonadales bacterium]
MATTTAEVEPDKICTALDAGVFTITLNDVAGRNVLGVPLMNAFLAALERAATDAAIRVVVVTNDGPVFCAGADLKAGPSDLAADLFRTLLRRVQTCPKPTIGKIRGHAVGGGVGLAAAFDIAVATEESKFGFTEVRLGVVPAVISAICLPKMRRSDALEMFLRGTRFEAPRAAELGLITRAVTSQGIDDEVAAITADIRLGGPEALRLTKQIVDEVPRMEIDAALDAMALLSARVFASDEARKGTDAFKNRQSPPWVE